MQIKLYGFAYAIQYFLWRNHKLKSLDRFFVWFLFVYWYVETACKRGNIKSVDGNTCTTSRKCPFTYWGRDQSAITSDKHRCFLSSKLPEKCWLVRETEKGISINKIIYWAGREKLRKVHKILFDWMLRLIIWVEHYRANKIKFIVSCAFVKWPKFLMRKCFALISRLIQKLHFPDEHIQR